MTGKLYVDEIRDVAAIGSPSFPNLLDITNLTDPVGSEGEVLTVQADGTILAAAPTGGGSGIPIQVDGITNLDDAEEVANAIFAAIPPLAYSGTVDIEISMSNVLCTEQTSVSVYDDGGNTVYDLGNAWNQTGAGSVLVWCIKFVTR